MGKIKKRPKWSLFYGFDTEKRVVGRIYGLGRCGEVGRGGYQKKWGGAARRGAGVSKKWGGAARRGAAVAK